LSFYVRTVNILVSKDLHEQMEAQGRRMKRAGGI
jgi:hypothetical protein